MFKKTGKTTTLGVSDSSKGQQPPKNEAPKTDNPELKKAKKDD